MKIRFSIEYYTQWGEDLRVLLQKIEKGGQKKAVKECRLETYDGRLWEGEITFQSTGVEGIEYKYAMFRDEQLVWTEWEVAPHRVLFDGITNHYILSDKWRPIPEDQPLFSSAYTECVGATPDGCNAIDTLYSSTLQLRVVEPRLRKGEWLAVCGSTPQLGEWQRPKRMALINLQEWAVNIDAELLYDEAEYKYVVVNAKNQILRWEEGPNRRMRSPRLLPKQMWVKTDKQVMLTGDSWKVAGVVIPVFSLRTARSYGVGDFGDLKALIQWVVKTKMHAIQILPINDTIMTGTWKDSYPYNSISIYAFNPLYCDINALPTLKDRLAMERFMMKQQRLNALKEIDYEQVIALKMEYLRMAYAQEGKEVMERKDYQTFFEENKDWLVPYAAFSYLRDSFGTAEFGKWPKHSKYNKKEVEKLIAKGSEAYDKAALYYYIQYQLHKQLLEVRNEARKEGVIIKGDIPIGISRNSVEAWSQPHLFNLDGQAGAPPDDFSENGQNWGFPTYNWEAMAEEGYQWWIRRFQKMAEYFDAYRIDHVLGFFRIWEIPLHSVHGLLGQFSPSIPMSINEIEGYGMRFNAEYMTRPFIADWTLERIFGYRADLVKTIYLQPRTDGRYDLKDEYASQRKIEAAFAGKTDEDSIALRDGLYRLASCVLFVPDRKYPEVYHPRISAQLDFTYESLPQHEKDAFNNLYNDYFYRRHNVFWYEEAMKKLPILTQSTRMLVCAEDLGMVPDCVPWVMENLKMLSLEIQRMPKSPALQFGHLWENPYRSVATISTHDMPPLRQWWDEDTERAQQFYNNALYKDGTAPHPAPGWLCEEIVTAHLFCPSVMTLLSLQDWLSMDERVRLADPNAERINIPANPRHYWRWRMHLTIEQLMSEKGLNGKIKSLIENSGRG
ncbi:MAG: 4-alpha-glucanotransferase [Bacteroidaceae bacterium]|nr:4-alpha-glucanotransferase [Bacteroidaceae bacterium]